MPADAVRDVTERSKDDPGGMLDTPTRTRLFAPVPCEEFVTESGRVLTRHCYNKTSYEYAFGNKLCTQHAKKAGLWYGKESK